MPCCPGLAGARPWVRGSGLALSRDFISVWYWSKIPYGLSRGEETQVLKMPKLAIEKTLLALKPAETD